MALTEENGGGGIPATMLVGPASMGNNMGYPYPVYMGNGGQQGFGGDWGSWIILFLIFGMFGAFGNNGAGGGFGGGGLYPWMNQSNQINDGFQNQLLSSQVMGIQNAVTNGFQNAEVAACNRAMNDMERSFAAQTANTQALFDLQSQFAQCCCENRLANCQTQNIIQNEASATRFADVNNTRDIVQSQTRGTQAILDKLCQLEMSGKDARIADLERQLTMSNLAASQTAQTAAILANNEAQTTALEQYLAPNPRPAYIVQNPACCNQNYGCGCGNNF